VKIGGLGVHLRLARAPHDDMAEQRHPPAGTDDVVRSSPLTTSSTDDRSSIPVIPTRSANSSSGYSVNAVVQPGHLVKHPPEMTFLRVSHSTSLPSRLTMGWQESHRKARR
jgi:hypothetical protein